MTTGRADQLVLSGAPRHLGVAHGAALRPRLRAFLADDRARLDRLVTPPPGDLGWQLDAYDAAITEQTPALAEELAGLAEGLGVTRHEAVLLQVRRELLGFHRVPTRGDCTTYARSGGHRGIHGAVLAQTVDLNGDLDDQIAVLDIDGSAAAHRVLVLSFGGLLGYLGLNDAGLAVGINLVLGGEWVPGLPPYLAVRHVLDHAGSVAEGIELLSGLRLASSRALTLCDATTVACVELPGPGSPGGPTVRRSDCSVHTNHFLHPEHRDDALNVFARTSSRRRLEACTERLRAVGPDASAEAHLDLLAAEPVLVHGRGDERLDRTVAAVAMFPERGELHLRPGDPSLAATRQVRLVRRRHREPVRVRP